MFSLLPSKSKNGNGSEYLIEVRDVVKTFKTAAGPFTALKNVSLRVNHGEFVTVKRIVRQGGRFWSIIRLTDLPFSLLAKWQFHY